MFHCLSDAESVLAGASNETVQGDRIGGTEPQEFSRGLHHMQALPQGEGLICRAQLPVWHGWGMAHSPLGQVKSA